MNEPRGDRIEQYECLDLLGKGAFASVYRARCRCTGKYVAIKMIDKRLMELNRMTERVKQEADIHRRLDHPAILQLFCFFEDANLIYLVLELAEHGDIQQYLRINNIQLTESETAHIMRQIVDGLKYLHAHNILHRDMKLPNLLVTADMRVKIADFGLATQLSRPDEPHMTMCGTPNYISPEVAQRTAHGQPADVWGLGIMMYTLLEGRPPFDTDAVATTLRRVVQAEIKMPERATPEARDLLDRLLQKDQQQRIRLDDVLRHPFMVKHGMTELAGGAADRRDVGAIVQAHDSGVMTMSTTPSISASAGQLVAPAQSFGRSQRFGGAQRQHEPIAEENEGMLQQYDLPPPRKPTAVDSGLVDTYRSSSNLNPFLGGGTDRSASVYNAPTADHRDIGGPMVLGHLQPKQHLQPRFDFNTPSSHRGRTALAPQAHRLHDQQENIPYNQQQQPQVVRGIAAIDVPQLNAERLLPTRYETKKAILSIDGRGRVLVELLRSKAPAKPAQRPADICRISRDGMRIEIVQADALQRSGDIEPDHSAVELYAYPLMPVKHWKKYTYAERFVQLVRAKTPKITYYSALAKCQLMETLDDFELFFYADDDRFTRSPADGVRFVRSGGSGVTVDERDFGVRLDGPTQQQRDHYQHCWQHCGALERALRAMPGDGEVFPCTVGRRPVTVPMVLGNAQQRREQLEQEQRCASVSSPRMPTMQSFAMSISSSTTSHGKPSPGAFCTTPSGRILIPGIGIASKSALGVLEVLYNDDTQLTVLPKEQGGGFVFRRSVSGGTDAAAAVPMRYTINDELPELVRVRLEQIPMVLKHMAAQETGGGGPALAAGAGGQIAATSTPLTTRKVGAMRFCR